MVASVPNSQLWPLTLLTVWFTADACHEQKSASLLAFLLLRSTAQSASTGTVHAVPVDALVAVTIPANPFQNGPVIHCDLESGRPVSKRATGFEMGQVANRVVTYILFIVCCHGNGEKTYIVYNMASWLINWPGALGFYSQPIIIAIYTSIV